MELSLWALRVNIERLWVSGSQWIDHLSEFIPYSTMTLRERPHQKSRHMS